MRENFRNRKIADKIRCALMRVDNKITVSICCLERVM